MIGRLFSRSSRGGGLFRLSNLRLLHESAKKQEGIADVVICGGGLIGLCQAIALGSNAHFENRRIILLESQPEKKAGSHPQTASGYSNRVVAFNQSSVDLLKSMSEIGVWQSVLDTKRVGIVRQMRVFDGCSDAAINFDLPNEGDLSGSDSLAYIAEVPAVLEALSKRVQSLQNVKVLYDANLKRLNFDWLVSDEDQGHEHENESKFDSFCEVHLLNKPSIRCRLLIGADGHNSTVRRLTGIHAFSRFHNQTAVVATLHCRKESSEVHNETAFQRFLPDGPIATLPLRGPYCSLVWSTSKQHAASLMRLSEAQFVEAVNRAFHSNSHVNPFARETLRNANQAIDSLRERFDPVDKAVQDLTVNFDRFTGSARQFPPHFDAIDAGSRATFDLSFLHATHYAKSRLVLIGDAAHRVLPLAGLGMNLGYGDVATLTKTLCEAVRCGADLGDFEYLRQYETERQRFNVPVAASIEALNSLYSNSFGPLVALRSLGLSAVNACRPLKDAVIRSAMYGVLTL